MSIRDWPEQERPREKLLRCGASGLSDAELLAVLLCTGVAGKSAVDVARELLQHFGGLRPLLQAEQRQLCALPGLGPAKFVLLQAVLEIGKRHLGETLRRGAPLGNPDQTRAFIRAQLRDHSIEVFGCLFLDNRNRVIRFEELARGTLDSASVHPREVIKKALQHNAGAVIFAHNHPSGVAEPSQADRRITARLQQGLALVDIRVLDHIVVGDSETVSFAERGLL